MHRTLLDINGTIRILQQKLSACMIRGRDERMPDKLPIENLSAELQKNERVRDKVSQAIKEAANHRSKLTSVVAKLFDTMQDKIHQLSAQVAKVNSCLEGGIYLK